MPLLTLVTALEFGSTSFSIFQSEWPAVFQEGIFRLRLTRVCVAFFSGSFLAVAGVLSQTIFQNPLATPTVLGTASGASFGAVLTFLLTGSMGVSIGFGATSGALISTSLLFWFIKIQKHNLEVGRLLLFGIALNTLFSAMSMLMISILLSKEINVPDIMYWLYGEVAGKGSTEIIFGFLSFFICLIPLLLFSRPIDKLQLGMNLAASQNRKVHIVLYFCLFMIAALVGSNMFLTGFIPFVGLIIPIISRFLRGNRINNMLLPSVLLGGSFTVAADLISRTILKEIPIQIGAMTAVVGAPVFIYFLVQDRFQMTGIKQGD